MQIQSISLLSSPYSSSSVGAPQSISVGQRASLPTQRQGLSVSNVVKPLLAVLEHLKPVRFSEDHRTLILNMFSVEQQASILPLLKALRHEPISVVGVDEENKPTGITLLLLQPVMFDQVEQLYQTALKFSERLKERLNGLDLPARCFDIQRDGPSEPLGSGRLILRISLKDQTPEEIQDILTHLPAIIKGLK
jgi:hypothetical protein